MHQAAERRRREAAATRIQAAQRKKAALQQIKDKKAEIQDKQQQTAAVTIQAAQRAKMARSTVKQKTMLKDAAVKIQVQEDEPIAPQHRQRRRRGSNTDAINRPAAEGAVRITDELTGGTAEAHVEIKEDFAMFEEQQGVTALHDAEVGGFNNRPGAEGVHESVVATPPVELAPEVVEEESALEAGGDPVPDPVVGLDEAGLASGEYSLDYEDDFEASFEDGSITGDATADLP